MHGRSSSLLLPLLAAAALGAGCGSAGGDPDADPAAVVPARAPVYLEATIDPDGETGEEVRALAQKLAGTADPGGRLKQLVERTLREDDPDFSYAKDIEPWLGDRIGVFASSIDPEGDRTQAALVAAVSDPDAARETLERELGERDPGEPAPKVADRTYREVEYRVDTGDDLAVAVLDEVAVAGTERAVREVVDAREGDALSEAEPFAQARDQIERDAVGFGFVRVSALLSALGPQGAIARQVLGDTGDTVAFGLDADADAIRVETVGLGVRGAGASGPGSVMAGLPADAWLTAGVADVGGQLERALQQVGQLGAFGGFDLEQVLGQVEEETGIDVRRDLLGWMGDAGVFVRGTSVADVGGALVVASSDPGTTARVIPRLGRLLRQVQPGVRVAPLRRAGVDAGITLRAPELPLPIHLAAAGDRFVLAVTDAALEAALSPSGRLGDTPAFRDATAKLGDGVKPALLVDLAPVRELLGSTGALQGPEAQEAARVLERLTIVAAGARRDGEVQRGRLVVGVK